MTKANWTRHQAQRGKWMNQIQSFLSPAAREEKKSVVEGELFSLPQIEFMKFVGYGR